MKKLILIAFLGAINIYCFNTLAHSIKYLFAKKKRIKKNDHLLMVTMFYLKKQLSYDANFAKGYASNPDIYLRAKFNTPMTPEEIDNNQTQMERLFIEHFINSKQNSHRFYLRIKKILGQNNKNIQDIDDFIKMNKNRYNK
jgi:hypothetical protein